MTVLKLIQTKTEADQSVAPLFFVSFLFTFFQIESLPEIVRAVKGRCEVYLDGGVRHGTDVVKALALGARAVFVGRPALWGLAYNVSQKVT